jgi:hypothetical protein
LKLALLYDTFAFIGVDMRRLFYLSLVLLFIVLSCSQESEFPVGYDKLDYNSPIYSVTLEPSDVWVDTYFSCYDNNGMSQRLLVGAWEGYKFRTLIRFNLDWLEYDPDKNITNAILRLHYGKREGEFNDNIYNEGDMTVYVAPVYKAWNELDASWYHPKHDDSWNGGTFGEPVGSFYLGEPTENMESIDIDITEMVVDWISDPNSNNGCILYAKDEGAINSIKELPATETISKEMPYIVITYDENNEKVEEIIKPWDDVTITYSDNEMSDDYLPGSEDELLIGGWNGFAYRACYKFDMSESVTGIPPEATVVLADLQLYFLPSSKSDYAEFEVHRVGKDLSEDYTAGQLRQLPFYYEHDWERQTIESQPAGYVNFYINQLVQGWISGVFPNYGLLIQEIDETSENGFLRFVTQQNPDESKSPKLVIHYTLPPE